VALTGIGDVRRGPNRLVQSDAGKEERVFAAFVYRRDDFVLQRPQQGLAPAARRDLRERRAPGAAADHADLLEGHAFTPAPRTFSASGSSGQRARAGASSGSVKPAAKRSAPAQA